MTKVRMVNLDKTRFYAIVLVPEQHVPKLLRMGDRLFMYAHTQGDRLVFKETEFLDAWTEGEFEQAQKNGTLT